MEDYSNKADILGVHKFSFDNIIQSIGNTPLYHLKNISSEFPGTEIYAKLEFFNPGGSVKDRPARRIILDALREGKISSQKGLIDATSGNTGVAYAMLGAALGVPVNLVMPKNVSMARKKITKAYGANLIFSDPLEGSDGAITMVRDLVAKNPEKYWYADQYSNPSNPKAHELGTAQEIIRDIGREISCFVAGIGTSGTIMGCCRGLKNYNPKIKVYAVEPYEEFHGIEGLKHMQSSIIPNIYHESELDGKISVETEVAWDKADDLFLKEGLFLGNSAAAALEGAIKLAREGQKGAIVTLFPDRGERYFEE